MILLFFSETSNEPRGLYEFIQGLPHETFRFIDTNRCNLVIEIDKRRPVNEAGYSTLLYNTHKETFEEHYSLLNKIERMIGAPGFRNDLRFIGMTEESLRLKTKRLRELYKRIAEQTRGFINVTEKGIRKTLSSFLEHLNSMLNSLSKLFPELDRVIELIDIIKNLLGELEAAE